MVSIPYGAIKSSSNPETRINSAMFQFLTVRLKEITTRSITSNLNLFQFLTVRLKDNVSLNE